MDINVIRILPDSIIARDEHKRCIRCQNLYLSTINDNHFNIFESLIFITNKLNIEMLLFICSSEKPYNSVKPCKSEKHPINI